MLKKTFKQIVLAVLIVFAICLCEIPVLAGYAEEMYDLSELGIWNITDTENITLKDGQMVIDAKNATDFTSVVMKSQMARDEDIEEMFTVESTIKLTALPKNQQFILAFGLQSVEATSGETGNIELVFTNQNGIRLSVVAYGEDENVTVVNQAKVNVSLQTAFSIKVSMSNKGVFRVWIGDVLVCNKQVPVTGEGRFGILQTGSCGAIISKVNVVSRKYERPENPNIVEDFEDGEFDASVLRLALNNTTTHPGFLGIEEYKGSKVLMWRNCGVSYLSTVYPYSNFQLSFDVPYYLHETIYDDTKLVSLRNDPIYIGIGEIEPYPLMGDTYGENLDLIQISSTATVSMLQDAWNTTYASLEKDFCGDRTKNQGFSVKMTMIDGDFVLQLKGLSEKTWTTVVEHHYSDFRSGHIFLRFRGYTNMAIDNYMLTNLDKNPKTIQTEYLSNFDSMDISDYELTEEETKLVFRDGAEGVIDKDDNGNRNMVYIIISVAITVVILAVIFSCIVIQKKKKKGAIIDEE